MICVRGATTGRTNIASFDACIGRGVALVRGWKAQKFLNYVLWSLGKKLLDQGKGTTFPSISYGDLAGLEIKLPPLEEQKRIVKKVDEVMKICDRVEENLSKKEELASAISDSVIHHLEL